MAPGDPLQLAREVLTACRDLGFAQAGITPARPSAYQDELTAWLAAGRHGSMDWLARHAAIRADPARLVPGCASLLMVADRYAARGSGSRAEPVASGHGLIARYARGRDYHATIKRRLHGLADTLAARFPAETFRCFVDTAPVLEREHAARAGLGWVGKNTLLITPRGGSYVLLGGIATTLALEPPPEQEPSPDHCGTCTRCLDACPTGAITPYSVDAARCLSYLTIEHRGPIEPGGHAPVGDWLFGCDVCQEVCPHNSPRPAVAAADATVHPDYTPRFASLDLLAVLGWTPADRSRALSGSSMKRARLDMLKRNALIVLGNQLARTTAAPDAAVVERLRAVAASEAEPDLVRRTAADVLARLAARDRAATPVSSGPSPRAEERR
ncbi:MAG TPA: tRNA epoxyqueuosine(34) reductase QueG [Phycisphaerales bacterium]|nr:tRNA epoxyqueuosine(34) reductase QueG [Phycisphaerales bacterium]